MGYWWHHAVDICGYKWERRENDEPRKCPQCHGEGGILPIEEVRIVLTKNPKHGGYEHKRMFTQKKT